MLVPVVGIGASAGGLEAGKLLLANLPANTGLAFVFVQHLDPKHHSNLAEILAKVSAIPVRVAADGMAIEPGHLYVTPPNADLEIANQFLRTTSRDPAPSGPHMPIDRFLRSLAHECGSRAIGVILSGAGADGASGLEAVKAAGGVTLAQDPATARFSSMPQAAICRGCVDFVLSPEGIAAELATLGHHRPEGETPDPLRRSTSGRFGPILEVLEDATGIDFSHYPENMIQRRIMPRLALRNLDDLEEYRKLMENDPGERSALHRDLLIGIPGSFRDLESFESLKALVYPHLLHRRPAHAPIRVWVPGCATGEAAFSIAITLSEYLTATGASVPVQIFGSDPSEQAIERARGGRYPENISSDISAERLSRYFSRVEGNYRIDKDLREMCIFPRHNLLTDPPFSKLDLLTCRNLQIDLAGVRNIIPLFHYALKPDGFLMLGTSEAEPSPDLFSLVDREHRIYSRRETVGKSFQFRTATAMTPSPVRQWDVDARQEVDRLLLSRCVPAGVVVDEALEVLEIRGKVSGFFSLPADQASFHLFELIPDTGLFLEVEKLIHQSRSTGQPARQAHIPFDGDRHGNEVTVEVLPLHAGRKNSLLILFEAVPAAGQLKAAAASAPAGAPDDIKDRQIAKLKQELEGARQSFLAVIQEHQLSQEESQNSAEEALSTNEELQSLNEELENAKAELQSTNEELAKLNQRLLSNNAALTAARDFALSVIDTVAAPLLILDTDLRIKAANPAFYGAFQIPRREAEGQLLYSLSNGCWDIPSLRVMLERILPDHKAVRGFEIEQDFPVIGRRVLVISARQLEGVQQILLGIDDVTERQKRADASLRESEQRFRGMADAAPVMIWVAGTDKACTFFNQGWLAFTGRTMQQELGDGWAAGVHPLDLDRCLDIYSSSFDARRSFQMEYRLRRADGEYRWLLDSGVPRFEPGGTFAGYIGSCIDITDLKRAQEESLAMQKLESVATLAGGIAHDFNNLLGGVLAHAELGLVELAGGSTPRQELESIRAVAIRGSEIVRQLMTYTGQEAEVLELVDVSQIVEEMVELLKVAVSKHATVETSLARGLPAVWANPSQLRQVVMNLITNASEAMGDRDGVILVTTEKVTVGRESPAATPERLPDGDYLQLQVSDTGCGMTPETRARIFDPFFTTRQAGHGLGLSVVQGVVRSLHGAIQLVSAPGEGATFRILLPCAADVPAAVQPAPPAQETKVVPRAATVLVVEDEDSLRHPVSMTLRKAGLTILEASDGHVALDQIRAHKGHIDILFLDISLPGVPSRQVFEEARLRIPAAVVIITSAYSRELAAAALSTTITHFIRKPYQINDLVNLMREALI